MEDAGAGSRISPVGMAAPSNPPSRKTSSSAACEKEP